MPSVTGTTAKVILAPYEEVSIKEGICISAHNLSRMPKTPPILRSNGHAQVTELSSLDVVKSRLRLSTKRFTEFDQEAVPLSKRR